MCFLAVVCILAPMTVAVSCACGKRFAAPDSLLGKRVPCPSCGSPIAIPVAVSRAVPQARVEPEPPAPNAASGIRVACQCGKAFLASATMLGKAARCPSCGGTILIANNQAAAALQGIAPPQPPPVQDISPSVVQKRSRILAIIVLGGIFVSGVVGTASVVFAIGWLMASEMPLPAEDAFVKNAGLLSLT